MTSETKKTWCLTGGVTAAIVVVVAILWLAGVFSAPAAQ